MMSRKFIKILCIVLAILMALSGIAVIFSTFAVDGGTVRTGDNDFDTIIPIAVAIVAVVAVIICVLIPKLKKKDSD